MSEKMSSKEFETKVTKIIIECRHHGEKEKAPEKDNRDRLLTPYGRQETTTRGEGFNPQPEVAVAEGFQGRTRESAAHMMLTNQDEISVDDSLEEMEDKIAKELKVGTKIHADKRLDFHSTAKSLAAYNEGRLLKFLIEESDKSVLRNKDSKESSYLRYAGNLAELYNKYSLMGDNFNRLANQTDKYEKFGNQIERYLSFHNGAAESFIAKLLEKTKGPEARDEYINTVGGNGYKGTQGFHTEIINNGKNQTMEITYDVADKIEKISIDRKLLGEIIEERKELEEKIEQK